MKTFSRTFTDIKGVLKKKKQIQKKLSMDFAMNIENDNRTDNPKERFMKIKIYSEEKYFRYFDVYHKMKIKEHQRISLSNPSVLRGGKNINKFCHSI